MCALCFKVPTSHGIEAFLTAVATVFLVAQEVCLQVIFMLKRLAAHLTSLFLEIPLHEMSSDRPCNCEASLPSGTTCVP
ncbi:hypothetical protein JTE90_020438 [Oedothorax gibbosus]|uniref:Uncharacterized protein n=1 Tax=Oedothorax gibbosus TaxID=931172 RepID=A0AAV6U0F2_9ARAC|nr:hypothetical protein JTE90_020438 [Oedothorax gibbosus]